jgi:hypothetical protein
VHVFHATANGKRKTFSLQDDLERLALAIKSIGDVSLVVLDAITSYMGGRKGIDSHRTTDVRSVLEPSGILPRSVGLPYSALRTHQKLHRQKPSMLSQAASPLLQRPDSLSMSRRNPRRIDAYFSASKIIWGRPPPALAIPSARCP